MAPAVRSAKKISISKSPADLAKLLSVHESFVFLDSSGHTGAQGKTPLSILACCPTEVLVDESSEARALSEKLAEREFESEEKSLPLGAAIGWFDYEGRATFGFFDNLLLFCHERKQWFEVGDTSGWFDRVAGLESLSFDREFTPSLTQTAFEQAVASAKAYIDQGIIYQVNLAVRYETESNGGSSYGLYEALRESSPAPMSAFVRLNEVEILSSSPELFLRMEKGSVVTKPIKGTRPRMADAKEDLDQVVDLQSCEKERAELLMITDLLRNDLGKVCKTGSVKVDTSLEVESYEQVHHLCSEISGELAVERVRAVTESLPGGSITGAPKRSAVQVINELEPVPRGSYTGSLGFFGYNDVSQFNLLIRSVVNQGGKLSYAVGAGIVADSNPSAEYEETQQKAKGIREAFSKYIEEKSALN